MKFVIAVFFRFLFLCLPVWADDEAWLKALKSGDYETALKELLPSARQGNAVAQTNLGLMYAKGEGVPRDDTEAVKWYRLAAEQGNAAGQYNLGHRYDEGGGVPQDHNEAVR